MSDLSAQKKFTEAVARLILAAYARGYTMTFGHAWRCEDCKVGLPTSFHKKRLAIDLNLFDGDGVYITDTEGWREIGELWESMGGTWGGRFDDANHISWGE